MFWNKGFWYRTRTCRDRAQLSEEPFGRILNLLHTTPQSITTIDLDPSFMNSPIHSFLNVKSRKIFYFHCIDRSRATIDVRQGARKINDGHVPLLLIFQYCVSEFIGMKFSTSFFFISWAYVYRIYIAIYNIQKLEPMLSCVYCTWPSPS